MTILILMIIACAVGAAFALLAVLLAVGVAAAIE